MFVLFGLVPGAPAIAMLVHGECGVALSPTHSLRGKQRLVVVNVECLCDLLGSITAVKAD